MNCARCQQLMVDDGHALCTECRKGRGEARVYFSGGASARVSRDIDPETVQALERMVQFAIKQMENGEPLTEERAAERERKINALRRF